MPVKLAVKFLSNETLKHKYNCVLCGDVLENERASDCAEWGQPPCCPNHAREVSEEVDKHFGMWPSGWHGNAWIGVDHTWWVNTVS